MNQISKIKLLTTLAALPFTLSAQQAKPKAGVLPLDPVVRTGKLPNGFQCRLVKKKGQKSFDILDKNS
jgi:hypothetical protein